METITISKTYTVKYWINDYICYTVCHRVINNKTGKEMKKFLRGNKTAIYIEGTPFNVEDLKPYVRPIECPF